MRQAELSDLPAEGSPVHQEVPVLVELHHTGVHVAVTDEDVAIRVPRDVRRPVEVAPVRPCLLRAGKLHDAVKTLFPAPQVHHDVSVRIELDDGIRGFVHDPQIVFVVEADLVSIGEPVDTLAVLAPVFAVVVEFEQLRRGVHPDRACVGTTRVVQDHDMALGVERHAEHLTEVHVG